MIRAVFVLVLGLLPTIHSVAIAAELTPATATQSEVTPAEVLKKFRATDEELAAAIQILQIYQQQNGSCVTSDEPICRAFQVGSGITIAATVSTIVSSALMPVIETNSEAVHAAILRMFAPLAGVAISGGMLIMLVAAITYSTTSSVGEITFDQSVLSSPENFKKLLRQPITTIIRYARQYPAIGRELILRAEVANEAMLRIIRNGH